MAKIKETMTVSLEEFGKKAGEYALDEFEYKGLTIRQWADKIASGEYQPVKHGWWVNLTPMGQRAKQRMTWHGCVAWMCSECHGSARFFSEDSPYELCPHCGAIMTFGGGEEEQRVHAEYMERAAKERASEDGDSDDQP